ncbi:unannotated protein [freshwater metagenome]|uniref:Unannotated protein n=1 Tax=freshwater metagenome TaxID=449393 RepID=A0A6J6WIP8_9ZZZZ
MGRVDNFGMILHSPDTALGIFQNSNRRIRCTGSCDKANGHLRNRIKVTHPYVLLGGDIGRDQCAFRAGDASHLRATIFATGSAGHLATELMRNQLRTVADAENRDTGVVDRWIKSGCTVDVHALGAAGKNDRRWIFGGDFGCCDRVRHDFGINVVFTDSASDQLRVLRPKIDDENGIALSHTVIVVGGPDNT